MPTLWVRHPFLVPYWRRGELAAAMFALVRPDPKAKERLAERLRGRLAVDGIVTASARLGLELALREHQVGVDDEVVLPTFACAALLTAVRRVGATPVFADVESELLLTPATAAAALSARTKAVIAIHDGGLRADVVGIREAIGDAALIEDRAQATGASWPLVGDQAIWSFGLGKNLIATRGGLVAGLRRTVPADLPASSRRDDARRLWNLLITYSLARYTRPLIVALRKYGSAAPQEDRLVEHQLTDISAMDAAILARQFESLNEILTLRRRNAEALLAELRDEPRVIVPRATDHVFTKFHLTLRDATRPSPGERAVELQALTRALLRAGFEPEAAYTPLHLRFPGGRDLPRPIAEDLYWRTFTLPVRPGIPVAEMRRMGATIREHLRR